MSGDDRSTPRAPARDPVAELEKQNRLLAAISRAQAIFLSGEETELAFGQLLDVVVETTASASGFLDEVLVDADSRRFKRNLALSEALHGATATSAFAELESPGLEFRDLDNPAGAPVIEGRVVIANDAPRDPRFRGLPMGHPPIARFMGVPLVAAGEIVGVVGVADRESDYSEELAAFIEPLTNACAAMIRAARCERRSREMIEALRISEEKYRRIAENITDVVWISDLELNLSYVSPSVERVVGEPPSVHLRRPIDEKLPPESLRLLGTVLAEELERERDPGCDRTRFREVELEHYRADGSLIWVSVGVSFVRGEQGRPVGLQGVTREITERKRAELALVESERKWRNILVETPQIGVSLDPDGRIVFANVRLLELTGWTEEEVLGGDWFELFIPEASRDQVREFFRSVRDSDPSVAFTSYENEIATRSGELRNIAWSNVVTRDADGAFVDVTCLGVDLTEHQRAVEKLTASEERYRLLVENANEMVMIAQDGRFAFVNRRAVGFLGYTPEELEGTPFADHIHPDDRAKVIDNHLRRLAGEQLEVYPFRILHRSGEARWVEIGAVLVEWQGRPATLNILLDVTDRIRAEEERERLREQLLQAQKMESVGRLAGGVAHDFNNMLGVILARSELALMETASDDPRTEDLAEIHAAASRSAELTRQLLAFARKQTIAPRLLDLNDAVEELLTMLRRLIGEDLELVWRPGAGIGPVELDPTQLGQAVTNLCVNARDAISGAGTINIATAAVTLDEADCAAYPDSAPGRYAALAVTDDGCGITDEVLSHLFEPFFTTKETGFGTGLGLATVFGIVRQNNGLIRVASEVGRGSTFTILLPCREGRVDDGSTTARPPPRAAAGETVLLVEDNPAILNVGRKMLERLGYTMLTAGSPEEALRIAGDEETPIDLLLTDVVMPGISGRELADRIAALRPRIAILYMSGYTADVIARKGVLEEGVHFIQKPFSMAELAAKVREVLDRDE